MSDGGVRVFRKALEKWLTGAYGEYVRRAVEGEDPRKVLEALEECRLLAAHREGIAGVSGLNRHAEWVLHGKGTPGGAAQWYVGRPVLVTTNDYNLRLFNGDVGVTLEAGDGRLEVVFMGSDGELRRYPPSRLPENQTVYAMTVHKSQGSEWDRVLLVLPSEQSRVLTRELLYTAITRARSRVEIWGTPDVFEGAVSTRLTRSSGLRDRLWPSSPVAPASDG